MSKSNDDLDEEVSHLRNRIDLMEENSGKKAWFANPSTLISLLALVVSTGTTLVSYIHTSQQDIHNLRTELQGILQRMTVLPKENAELAIQFKNEPSSLLSLSGFIGQENIILTQQAEDAIKRLPADQVSAIDYYTVGQALQNAQKYDEAIVDFTKASQVASGLADSVGSLRTLANLQMAIGLVGPSRSNYQKANDIVSEYRLDDFTKLSTYIQTDILWAASEMNARHTPEAQQHVEEADTLTEQLTPGPAANMWKIQVAQAKQYVSQPAHTGSNTLIPGAATQIGAPQPVRPGLPN